MRGFHKLVEIPTGFFFHIVKPPMPILALLPMLCICENPDVESKDGKNRAMAHLSKYHIYCTDHSNKRKYKIYLYVRGRIITKYLLLLVSGVMGSIRMENETLLLNK